MSEKVIPDKKPSSKVMLLEDEYINENLKRLCANNGGKIEFVSRENGYVNRHKLYELIELFHRYDLADIKTNRSTLTRHGQIVCDSGGWIEYMRKENQSFRLENNKNNPTITTTDIIPTIIPSKKITIFGVGIWQIIIMVFFGVLTIWAMFYIAYKQGVFY